MLDRVRQVLKDYWGYDSFLPLQKDAMSCVLERRDSIVVLPTGGGKSLCYQAPAVASDGMAIVVSPLISLMKDQVDALSECGVPAARIDSSLSAAERREAMARAVRGDLELLYAAPERVLLDGFTGALQQAQVSSIAIDEAHCVSMWGHDFRPEYQQLGALKEAFPGASLHAYTATATAHVREDIEHHLGLHEPSVLVGSFDRPNLTYRALPRSNAVDQVCGVIEHHAGGSGIVYCIRRADVDSMCAALTERGHRALPYHAGLSDEDRRNNQDAFISEDVEVIVATVAFGMGIDKPNVRYVVHAGMPKSLEHYQQESGRAGRDGLPADCWLLYSGGDFGVWHGILRSSGPTAQEVGRAKLNAMYQYCTGVVCRHRAILRYFGQDLESDDCRACDVCLGELPTMDGALETAQKILSCVARLKGRYGAAYTASVLIGDEDERVMTRGHWELSTHGILSEHPKRAVRDWIEQLIGQGCLQRSGAFNIVGLTERSAEVLRGEETPMLLAPAATTRGKTSRKRRAKPAAATKVADGPAEDPWDGVDEELFEALRALRKEIADKKRAPAYVVFADAALMDMARRKPTTPEGFLEVKGVGQKKCAQYARRFLAVIDEHTGG